MKPVEWWGTRGVLIHVAFAVVGYALLRFIFGFEYAHWLVALNWAIWSIREMKQHWPDPAEVISHKQSFLEWLMPTVAVIGIYLAEVQIRAMVH